VRFLERGATVLVTRIEDEVGLGWVRAKKKRDTFVVSRWRGRGACRSRAPH